jgi:hypothetical protein
MEDSSKRNRKQRYFSPLPSLHEGKVVPELEANRDTRAMSRTLRCHRLIVVSLLGILFFGAVLVVAVKTVVSGDLPDRSPARLLAAIAMMVVLLGLLVLMVASLRARLIVDDDGVDIVYSFSRKRVAWPTVERVSVTPGLRLWRAHIWADGRPYTALICPVIFSFGGISGGRDVSAGRSRPRPGAAGRFRHASTRHAGISAEAVRRPARRVAAAPDHRPLTVEGVRAGQEGCVLRITSRRQVKPEIRDGAEHMNDMFQSKNEQSA